MWCDKCQAEVAAAAPSDNDRSFCSVCGGELSRTSAGGASFGDVSLRDPLRDPRELLARWAREDALGTLDGESLPVVPRSSIGRSPARYDAPHSVNRSPGPHFEPTPTQPAPPVAPVVSQPDTILSESVTHRVDAAHATNPPHLPVAPVVPAPDPAAKWVTLAGQLFAYFGVGGLTVGTVLVLMGYFGGPASYATTGWLVATAGQMLLFLGVITLVSGGMEQTTQEVARRIETIGERLERIEKAALATRDAGPTAP